MVETINKFQQIERQLIQDLGREPLAEEIAAEMGQPIEKVRHIRKISQDTVSLETSVGDDDEDSKLEDFLEDVKTISPDRQAARELLKDYVNQSMLELTPREQKILEMRFGLTDGVSHTLEEVGREFDVTRERIRQIEAKALEKFRRIHSSKNSETIKEKQATACMKRKSEQIGKGMAAWSKGLESAAPDLARKLDRPRQAGWDALEELDLPRYVRVHISVEEFLDDPAKTTAEIPSKRLFVFLQPKEGLPVRKTKLTLEEAVAFVRQTVGEHPENWEADIAETEEEKFGGNIVVKKDGRAIIEMTTQGQGRCECRNRDARASSVAGSSDRTVEIRF